MSRKVIVWGLLLTGILYAGFGARPIADVAVDGVVELTFPTVADATFTDDYHAGRGAGRAHRATDLFAPAGSPVFAAVGGTVSWMPGRHPNAGYALHVRGHDGRLYAYYHLGPDAGPASRAYAAGIEEGVEVARGQHIGYVGDSGNAVGGRPHLHFEIHDERVTDPYGTNRMNPHASLVAALARGDVVADERTANRASRGQRSGIVQRGDRGSAVAQWQEQLAATGASITVDGIFGPQTDEATRAFQEAQGIAVDGIVGPQTRAAMAAALSEDLPLLRVGDRGLAVAEWQDLLNAAGARIAVDGIFGPRTDEATRAFQEARGIAVDGIVGPQTRAAIAAAMS